MQIFIQALAIFVVRQVYLLAAAVGTAAAQASPQYLALAEYRRACRHAHHPPP